MSIFKKASASLNKNNLKKAVGYLAAVLFGLIVTFAILRATESRPWNPLGPYPVQSIKHTPSQTTESVNNEIIPYLPLSRGYIEVQGSKCSKENVLVNGVYGWNSVEPGGFTYNIPKGPPGRRLAGCQQFEFKNDIPPKVKAWAIDAIADGRKPEIYLAGCETPISRSGKTGVEICWRTEPFAFYK